MGYQTVDRPHWLPYYAITHILQNIFFCVQEKNEIHTGLEQSEGAELSLPIF